ncbi:unnamed protein product, partial [Musa acuminata subsp. burmannicoides]
AASPPLPLFFPFPFFSSSFPSLFFFPAALLQSQPQPRPQPLLPPLLIFLSFFSSNCSCHRRSRSPFFPFSSSSPSLLPFSSSFPAIAAAATAAATATSFPSPLPSPSFLLLLFFFPSPPRRHTHPLLCFLCRKQRYHNLFSCFLFFFSSSSPSSPLLLPDT